MPYLSQYCKTFQIRQAGIYGEVYYLSIPGFNNVSKLGLTYMTTKTIRRTATIQLACLSLIVGFASQADATQHKQIVNGKEVIVHSNPIPVILHRLVPPQHGRHVTQKEVATRQIPQPRAIAPNRKRP